MHLAELLSWAAALAALPLGAGILVYVAGSFAMMRPHVVQFLDFTSTTNLGEDISIEQVPVSPKSRMIARTIREMQIGSEYGVIVMAIRHSDGAMVFNPAADAPIRGGDFLIVMGRQDGLRALEKVLGE